MTSIKNLLDELLNHQDTSVPEVMDKYLSTDYRQRTDGNWDDRASIGLHFEHLRTITLHADISVLDELSDGHTYADRHIVHVTKRDGGQVTQEVYLFAHLDAQGRFTRRGNEPDARRQRCRPWHRQCTIVRLTDRPALRRPADLPQR